MLKMKSDKSGSGCGERGRKSRGAGLVILALVSLSCVISTSLLGQVDLQKQSNPPSGAVSFMSLSGPPSKEYVHAGSRLVATVEPPVNDAQFLSMSYWEPCDGGGTWLPVGSGSFGLPDQNYGVRVTMKNTGSDEWPAEGDYFLGSQNPPNNETWGAGKSRISLNASVPPTGTVTFEFSVKRPLAGGNFQWQMVQGPASSGVFFGQMTTIIAIPGGIWLCSSAPSFLATFVSQSVPAVMFAGQNYSVSITMNNSGVKTWQNPDCKLGSQIPQDNLTWALNRVPLPSSTSPGQEVTFTFTVTAPGSPGEYNFQWMMVLESETPQQWFGYVTPTTFAKVIVP